FVLCALFFVLAPWTQIQEQSTKYQVQPLPPSFALRRDIWRVDLQNTTRVFVQAIANFLRCRAFLFLNTHGEALAVALSFYFRGQIALHIRTAIRRVMLLVALVVSKHINAIEIRF